MTDYKDINLDREKLDDHIQDFMTSSGYSIDGEIETYGKRKRVVFGRVGADFATVDLHLNKTGTTTIQWKIGKNQPVGEELATHLRDTINPAEFESVNYSLKGITAESFDAILDLMGGGIEVVIDRDQELIKQITLKSLEHQDSLKLTHHRSTRVLQIQGKPLSCYRRVIFMLTDLLDLKGLEQVLYRKDESSADVVRKEMAEDYLKTLFPHSYNNIPGDIKKLLISSCCVKLAAPNLPDYCLLLYPDLRSLEGVLKIKMAEHNLSVQDAENGFGDFFDIVSGKCTLKREHQERVPRKLVKPLSNGYTFYRKHRHAIFHMEEFPGGSRMIDSLESAIGLSRDAYSVIDALMQ